MISTIKVLEDRLGADWGGIRAARARTDAILGRLETALAGLHDANYSVIVTGSLGRGEATEGSDADWLLLVDGRSDPEHAILTTSIRSQIVGVVPKDVGPTGTFGDIVRSHELIHYIAGTRDSNENLTRRSSCFPNRER